MLKRKIFWAGLAALLLAGLLYFAVGRQKAADERFSGYILDNVVAALEGEYSNAAQYAAADASLKITPEIGDVRAWIDQKHAVFKLIDNPSFPGRVIALEWRENDSSGKISRQRLWAFRNDGPRVFMDFYSLKAEADFSDDAALSLIGPQDVIAYGDKCALPMGMKDNQYYFAIPETCRITTRSGRDMILSAGIIIGEGLSYREAGVLIDGAPIFQVPGGGLAYKFERLERQ